MQYLGNESKSTTKDVSFFQIIDKEGYFLAKFDFETSKLTLVTLERVICLAIHF